MLLETQLKDVMTSEDREVRWNGLFLLMMLSRLPSVYEVVLLVKCLHQSQIRTLVYVLCFFLLNSG